MPIKTSFFTWFHNEKEDIEAVRRYLLKYLYVYPLRAACSVVVAYPGQKFIEEYVLSQLLLQWVVKDNDFFGIRYESCSADENVKALGGHNLVLVTKSFDCDGYDHNLREHIKVGTPEIIDTASIEPDPLLRDLYVGRNIQEDPFAWDMDAISSDFECI